MKMINECRRRNVDRVLNDERRAFVIKHKLIQVLIPEWVSEEEMDISSLKIDHSDSNKVNNTPEPSTSVVISNEEDSSAGDYTRDSKVRLNKKITVEFMGLVSECID